MNDFFLEVNHIEFIVKDYDAVGDNDTLGSVLVNKDDLLAGEGERINYELTTKQHTEKHCVAAIENKKVRRFNIHMYVIYIFYNTSILIAKYSPKTNTKSYLALCCKTATKDEIEFMHTHKAKKSRGYAFGLISSRCLTGVFTEDSYLPPQYHHSLLLKKYQRKAKDGVTIQY